MRNPLVWLFTLAFLALGAAFYLTLEPSTPASRMSETKEERGASSALFQLRLGHNMNEQSTVHEAAMRFANEVAEKSQGEIAISLHPAQQLGTDEQMLEMARVGELDLLLTPTAKLSSALPAMQYADLPFYFDNREELYAMLDGEPGDILLEQMGRIGLVGFTFWENGFKHFTANRPLTTPDDFAGLRMRTMKSPMIMEQFRRLGATPVPIEFYATRQALTEGVVDGQENPLASIVSMEFYKAQSHLTLSHHAYLGYVFAGSAKSLQALPIEFQSLIAESARGLTGWERDEVQRREAKLLETIRAAGVEIQELDAAQRAAFRERLSVISHRYEEEAGPLLLSKSEELRWRAGKGATPQALVVALDADLSGSAAPAGLAIKRGMEQAVMEINQRGGVLGKPLKVIARDHRGMPNLGEENVRHFASLPETVAVFTGLHSSVALKQLEAVHELKIPLLDPWAAARGITENSFTPNYVFRVSINDRHAGPFMVDAALNSHRRIALLLENSAWGRGNETTMRQRLAEHSNAPVHVEWFNWGDGDFETKLTQIELADADVILMVANPVEGIAIVNAMAARNNKLPIISHWGIIGGDFWDRTRDSLQKVSLSFLQTFSFLKPETEQAKQLLASHLKHYGLKEAGEIAAPTGVAHAYDLVHLLARAINKAGNSDRAAIRSALEQLGPHKGAVKHYDNPFSTENHDALTQQDLRLARFDQAGHIVLLK